MRWVLRVYRRLARADRYFERRLTPLGRLLMGLLVVSGLFALDTRRTQAYQLFSVLVALVLVSFVLSLRSRSDVHIVRRLPAMATARQPFEYVVEVTVPRAPSRAEFWLHERLAQSWPTATQMKTASRRDTSKLPWFAYRRWYRLVRQSRGGVADDGHDVEVVPGEKLNVKFSLHPTRRGYIHFESMDAGRADPLGLCRAVKPIKVADRMVILPSRWAVTLPAEGFGGRDMAGGGGAIQGIGLSQEFHSLREYRPGDALRHIHMRAWARRGEPVVREFQAQALRRQVVVLDHYGTVSGDSSFEAAVSVAASVVESAGAQGANIQLVLAGVDGTAEGDPQALLVSLAAVQPVASARLAEIDSQVTRYNAQLAGVICVLTAWDEKRQEVVRRLKARGAPIRVIVCSADLDTIASQGLGPMMDRPKHFQVVNAEEPGTVVELLA
jgi:uncharacterized protein (DUF58 family)